MRKRHEEIKFYKSMTYRNKVRRRTEMNIIMNKIVNSFKKIAQMQIDTFFNPEITKPLEGVGHYIRK